MKVGETVVITWEGNNGDYKVKIDVLNQQGIQGPWEHLPGSPGYNEEYCKGNHSNFPWDKIIAVRPSTTPLEHDIEVRLNSEYKAVVRKDFTKVGCQEISNDRILAVADAIRSLKG